MTRFAPNGSHDSARHSASLMPPASTPSPSSTPAIIPPAASSPLPVLSPDVISVVKSTAPVLAAQGPHITQAFYPLLFSRYPAVQELFNKRNQAPEPDGTPARQPQALANAVWAYAANIDNLSALSAAVSLIAHKHASLHVLPEHYPMVGECLLAAIAQVLGPEVATEEVLKAWGQAYGFLAAVFVQTEDGLRASNARKRHGWTGWKTMRVARKVMESEDVASFYLSNVQDGEPVCAFLPGQYISLRLTLPNGEVEERDYSLSEFAVPASAHALELGGKARSAEEEGGKKECKGEGRGEEGKEEGDCPPYFRISIKRLPGGAVSAYMHDKVEEGSEILVGPPYGDFVLAPPSTPSSSPSSHPRPLVLLSAGIGITPLLCMAEAALLGTPSQESKEHRPSFPSSLSPRVFFLHTARDAAHFPFAARLASLAARHPTRFACHVSFTQGSVEGGAEGGKEGKVRWGIGRLTASALHEALGGKVRPQDCSFYFCGPAGYMVSVRRLLTWLGVPAEEVKYECFGPASAEVEAAGVVPSSFS